MDKNYDAIIVGGGHNGLVNGAYLAKAGLKVLIVERRHLVGGAAITEELRPGFHFTSFSYALSLLRPDIVHELDLVRHGFMPILMPSSFAPMENGDYLLLGQDRDENIKEIMRHSPHDADAMDRYEYDVERVCQVVKPLLDKVPPNIFGGSPEDLAETADLVKHLSGVDQKVIHDLVRLLTGSAADFLDDYFESDILKGYIASSGIIGTKVGPMSQGSGLVLLYHHGRARRALRSLVVPQGRQRRLHPGAGPGRAGLRRRDPAQRPGGLGDHQERRGGGRRARGRDRADREDRGQRAGPAADLHPAGRAAGAAQRPGGEHQPDEVPGHLREGQLRRSTGRPATPALGDRTDQYMGFVNIGPSMEYLERAFDDAKYGWYSKRPYIDCAIQSFVDPDMAPPGKHVMSCFVQYAPYHLKGSDWDTEREKFADTVQDTFESFFPGFGDLVLQREVKTPLDIERTVGLTEGNIFAGEFLAPQMYFFRPAPGWSQYRTPIDGYYQCGSGTHPGGCVMGAPGRLASQQTARRPEEGR